MAQLTSVLDQLDRLEEIVLDATPLPFSGSRLVNERDAIELMDAVREALPLQLAQAEALLACKEELISEARKEANEILKQAYGEREKRVNSQALRHETYPPPTGRTTEHSDQILNQSKNVAESGLVHHEVSTSRARPQLGLRRRKSVRIFLNEDEMSLLDQIAVDSGLDRGSVFRHLLLVSDGADRRPGHLPVKRKSDNSVSRISITDMGAKPEKPVIALVEPKSFDEMPRSIQMLREGSAVILNLTMMEPDQAQRGVDFVAGGTFYGDGHQERVGESIFLFCPAGFTVVTPDSNGTSGSDGQALIEGDSGDIAGPSESPLTELQESSLRVVRERWEDGQQYTTPHDLASGLSSSSNSDASFRLFRRVLFFLAKRGMIQKSREGDGECFEYKPVPDEAKSDLEDIVNEELQKQDA
jgi:hypothetical protein